MFDNKELLNLKDFLLFSTCELIKCNSQFTRKMLKMEKLRLRNCRECLKLTPPHLRIHCCVGFIIEQRQLGTQWEGWKIFLSWARSGLTSFSARSRTRTSTPADCRASTNLAVSRIEVVEWETNPTLLTPRLRAVSRVISVISHWDGAR